MDLFFDSQILIPCFLAKLLIDLHEIL